MRIDYIKKIECFLNNSSDKENLEFEKMVINNDFVHIIKELMIRQNITKKELAKTLKITNKKLENLFSSDELFDITLIAKLQRIFNTKLIITTNEKTKKNERTNK